jgi:TPR repeat protein
MLGYHYEHGLGVASDIVRAHVWYSLAQAHSVGALRDLFHTNVARVEERMTDEQVAESERLAREWDTSHLAGR